jgi:hypothetical protein
LANDRFAAIWSAADAMKPYLIKRV